MFCSDGVCGLVEDDEIEAALRLPTLEAALERLVSEALAEGGIDNITVIVADVVADDGTDAPVVLGAADERDIPAGNGTGRLAAADEDDLDEDDDPSAPHTATVDDEARYTPRAPGRRRLVRPLIGLLVLLLVAGAGLGAAYAWTRTQFYVGVAGDQVAIYQGLADGVPGVSLSRVYEVQTLPVSALPPYYATTGPRQHRGRRPGRSPRRRWTSSRRHAERCAAASRRRPRRRPRPPRLRLPDPPPPRAAPTATASAVVTASPSPTAAPTEPEC